MQYLKLLFRNLSYKIWSHFLNSGSHKGLREQTLFIIFVTGIPARRSRLPLMINRFYQIMLNGKMGVSGTVPWSL